MRIAVIGTGLIGGSLGLRLRSSGFAEHVVGCGRTLENLETALARGCIDSFTHDPVSAVDGADLVFLSVPVATMPAIMGLIAGAVGEQTVITDGGSTKQDVWDAARTTLQYPNRFVPGHPIAGTENSGAAAADGDLFVGRRWILTPVEATDADALDRVKTMAEQTGAVVQTLSPGRHDQIFGWVSHLPHLIAFALAAAIGDDPDVDLEFGGGGLNDFLRIAASDPVMWRDIFVANQAVLRTAVDQYASRLNLLMELVNDPEQLEAQLHRIRDSVRAARGSEADDKS